MNVSTPLDAVPQVAAMTEIEYLHHIYLLLVVIAIVVLAGFVHNILRVSFRMIRGDIHDEK